MHAGKVLYSSCAGKHDVGYKTNFISLKAVLALQTLRGKRKYQITNVGVEKIKLSRSLVQRIDKFKMNEIQRKHHSKI